MEEAERDCLKTGNPPPYKKDTGVREIAGLGTTQKKKRGGTGYTDGSCSPNGQG